MWRSYREMWEALLQNPDLAAIKRAFSLSKIAHEVIYPESFDPDVRWGEVIIPTAEGNRILREIGDSAVSRLALFGLFFHREFLIDPVASNLSMVRDLIQQSILSRNVLVPHITGRELYDKFNEEFSTSRTDHLDPPDVLRLLQGTTVGVFQVGTLITGPFGILESREVRWTPPTQAAPLWHCSDTGCNALHTVWLRSGHRPLLEVYHQLQRACIDDSGLPSEWPAAFRTIVLRSQDQTAEILFADLLPFLSSCIVGQDRQELMSAVLSGDHRQTIRDGIESSPRGSDFRNLSAEQLSSRLTSEEALQLLALMRTDSLVQIAEELILQRRLLIQPEELRRAAIAPARTSNRDVRTEMSSYGLRSPGRQPLVRLKTAIEHAYRAIDGVENLRWRVRAPEHVSTGAVLASFIEREGPRVAVAELVIPERRVFERIAERTFFRPAQDESGDERTDRLLWKLGFNIPRYGGALSSLRRRLDEFNQCLLNLGSAESETDRESIRRSGVNLFVSLEDYLERLVSYNCWLCSSDHFLQTRFAYSRIDAVASVPTILGNAVKSGDGTFSWNNHRENSLGTLQVYLEALLAWLASRGDDRSKLTREKNEMPWYMDDPGQEFPFLHTQLWADCDLGEFNLYITRVRRSLSRYVSQDSRPSEMVSTTGARMTNFLPWTPCSLW